jgi:hypothetical protein
MALFDDCTSEEHAIVLIDTVCVVSGAEDLIGPANARQQRLRSAIAQRNTGLIFDTLLASFSYQGISDHVASAYMEQHGCVTWKQLERSLASAVSCPKLQSYWQSRGCGYLKGSHTCNEPCHFRACPLPQLDLRNGRLNQTAYSLYLFTRDVANGDIVGWIDGQLSRASQGPKRDRLPRMREALIGPLRNVFGVSDKVLSMSLADFLMSAPAEKKNWFATGASMIAIDTLVHNFLHRTGILRRFGAQHVYGSACYRPDGCADVISRVANNIDARQHNSGYPKTFPRFVQHAIWRFCAQQELDICNGNRISDERRCSNKGCPLFHLCDRVTLQKATDTHR